MYTNLANVDHKVIGITNRQHGVSPYPSDALNMALYIDDKIENVHENQRRLAEAIQFDVNQWVFPIQTHESFIAEVGPADRGTNIQTLTSDLHGIDGLYTYSRDVLLTMCYADCVPVYFYSTRDDFIALAHAGWRGTKGRIVQSLIDVYAEPENLKCIIGPSICENCYEVNEDIKSQFRGLGIDEEPYFELKENGLYKIDLQGINRELVISAGVPAEHIEISGICTAEDERFFSYRTEKGNTGRMLAFIGTRDEDASTR
ncbi:peptidoglycan editing factor PgeF [Macrococcus hajekii]|uniref:Purine nucleoside phosphorylase n=1 Tax=Macrococcus hajekii TaxID=198482 RepID=A0A4R6BN63_9STAP|nr:peptidoglycan editing factor PgeF [Macrococcus hajekii]TDM03276.1 peptidoglycan editing factor PgeF [Macrococcus hajekii]GGA97525.1 laccase domain protein [Macrococcus hajekii]